MEWLSDPSIWMGLATLVILEIILGIDNLVFIAILADKLPPEQRDRARLIGLSLALLMRLVLLATLSWIMRLTDPLFALGGQSFSGRDLILLAGGAFLLFKATMELHERLEGADPHQDGAKAFPSFALVIAQIVVLDAVFSLDSVITAVGMVDELGVMIAAVVIAMAIMMLASRPLTRFVGRHPTVVILCLGFLLMIGFSLLAEGLGFKIPKGYLYAAIAFSILIEGFNQWSRFNRERRQRRLPFRQRTAEAVLRLLGARGRRDAQDQRDVADAADEERLEPSEQHMIRSVLTLAERPVTALMTVRADLEWLDSRADAQDIAQRLAASPHTRMLVCDGELDRLQGVVQSRDLLANALGGAPLDLVGCTREPLVLPETTTALRALDRIREHPLPLAIVVDEYGSIEGLVTANDLLAAIAGDLADTQDADYGALERETGVWEIDGAMHLDEIERLTGLVLPRSSRYQTLSGLFLHQLDRLPAPGDRVVVGDVLAEVFSLDRRRVGKALLRAASESAA
ncbi:TerC family protein [Pseudoxanthomonas winnipegensis]|uniref:TerC family protein n=1 Tax=Pseudoxanthomonas winnipegensis TaxID=2480810 RepID=A0A4Q8L4R4_9GAMM|nr:TerC family protein [Pseudoxanthomonas winnipegensis]TAA20160.1 TerC family protein [Pseudoxanthomonas winnipegensis]